MKGMKTGGRQKGTPNKATASIRMFLKSIIVSNAETIFRNFQSLQPMEMFQVLTKLAPYILPPMKAGEEEWAPEGELDIRWFDETEANVAPYIDELKYSRNWQHRVEAYRDLTDSMLDANHQNVMIKLMKDYAKEHPRQAVVQTGEEKEENAKQEETKTEGQETATVNVEEQETEVVNSEGTSNENTDEEAVSHEAVEEHAETESREEKDNTDEPMEDVVHAEEEADPTSGLEMGHVHNIDTEIKRLSTLERDIQKTLDKEEYKQKEETAPIQASEINNAQDSTEESLKQSKAVLSQVRMLLMAKKNAQKPNAMAFYKSCPGY